MWWHMRRNQISSLRKRTNPFKLAGTSVHSATGSRGVRIGGSNAGYTTFQGSVKSTGYPLHSPVSPHFPYRVPSCFNWTLPKSALKLSKFTPARISVLCGVTVGCWGFMLLDTVHSNSSLLWTQVHQLTNMSANKQFNFGRIAFFCLCSYLCDNLNISLHFAHIIWFKMSRKQNTENSGTNEKRYVST